ncbi:MAG: diacylglycerol kinase family lipid kinase [Phycisphaerae bacterium]|nr:diacylglycerol kinase family lipid kinase [Phycisphaerae bacterium]
MEIKEGYVSYIVNPKSGASSAKNLVTKFKEYLLDKGVEVRTHFTESLAHACELATKSAVDFECKLVVGCGGDGTLREIAHGLEGSDTPLLVIPAGTENLLANELGFNEKVETTIKAFEGDCIKPLDLGSANGKCFTSIAGFGFDGEVVKRVSAKRFGHINHLDYFWPIWRTFWSHEFPKMKVVVDDEEVFDGRSMVFVGNISRYAIGLQILRSADFGDGLLDVCVYRCGSMLRLFKHAMMTLFKLHTRRPDVVYRQGKKIELTARGGKVVDCEIDGDPGPGTPMKIEVIPQAVNVLVPPNARPAGIRTRLIRMIG